MPFVLSYVMASNIDENNRSPFTVDFIQTLNLVSYLLPEKKRNIIQVSTGEMFSIPPGQDVRFITTLPV